MNCCVFSGRLTKDIEVRQTQTGKSVGSYTIAVDSGYGENKHTLFLNCTHWNCEGLAPYLLKGKPIIVRGELRQRDFTDKNGQQRRVTELVVLESNFQQGDKQSNGGNQPQAKGQHKQSQPQGGFVDDSDIPF